MDNVLADLRARISTMANEMREYHDCEHKKFTRRMGRGRCENCQDKLPIYLLVSVVYLKCLSSDCDADVFVSSLEMRKMPNAPLSTMPFE